MRQFGAKATGTTLGRAWPLLAGERGEYAVAAGGDGTPVDQQDVVAERYTR